MTIITCDWLSTVDEWTGRGLWLGGLFIIITVYFRPQSTEQ